MAQIATVKISDILFSIDSNESDRITLRYLNKGKWCEMSYLELQETSDSFSKTLRGWGISTGIGVATLMVNSPEWNIADMAILLAGGVHISLFPTFNEQQLVATIKDTQPVLIVSNQSVFLQTLQGIKKKYSLSFAIAEVGYLTSTHFQIKKYTSPSAPEMLYHQSIAAVVFTSGTSSHPKGVLVSHEAFLTYAASHKTTYPQLPYFKSLSFLPATHAFERSHYYYYYMQRATINIAASSLSLRDNLLYTGAEFMTAVPQLANSLASLINEGDFSFQDCPLKILSSSGAALKKESNKTLENAGIMTLESYGQTEALGISSNTIHETKTGSVGKPLSYLKIKINAKGEILVKSPTISKGYCNKDFDLPIESGWLHTGDAGYLDDDGYLFIKGRVADIFKLSNGKQVCPTEIEETLSYNQPFKAFICGRNEDFVTAIFIVEDETNQFVGIEIKKRVADYNAAKPDAEKIKMTKVIQDRWSAETGELTHSGKIRRGFIEQKYTSVIESLYSGDDTAGVFKSH